MAGRPELRVGVTFALVWTAAIHRVKAIAPPGLEASAPRVLWSPGADFGRGSACVHRDGITGGRA